MTEELKSQGMLLLWYVVKINNVLNHKITQLMLMYGFVNTFHHKVVFHVHMKEITLHCHWRKKRLIIEPKRFWFKSGESIYITTKLNKKALHLLEINHLPNCMLLGSSPFWLFLCFEFCFWKIIFIIYVFTSLPLKDIFRYFYQFISNWSISKHQYYKPSDAASLTNSSIQLIQFHFDSFFEN